MHLNFGNTTEPRTPPVLKGGVGEGQAVSVGIKEHLETPERVLVQGLDSLGQAGGDG